MIAYACADPVMPAVVACVGNLALSMVGSRTSKMDSHVQQSAAYLLLP